MTDIEKKALALAIEVREDDGYRICRDPTLMFGLWEALCRAIEQHEAFRQEVSDVVSGFFADDGFDRTGLLRRFIIAEPVDPLRDLAEELARESQDLNLPLRKRVDWFEAQLRERGVTAPARGEEA